jgi:hypothetical protein
MHVGDKAQVDGQADSAPGAIPFRIGHSPRLPLMQVDTRRERDPPARRLREQSKP